MIPKSVRVLRCMLVGLAASAMACSALTSSGGGTGGNAADLPDNLPEETHPGDYISYQGFYFAVLQVLDPASGSAVSNPQPGMRNVALEIVAGNQNGDLGFPFSLSFGGLSDGNGNTYGQVFGQSGSGIAVDLSGFLDRGERVRGWMDFSMPEGVRPALLNVSMINPAGGWKNYSYGLTPPPDGYSPVRADTSRSKPEASGFGKASQKEGCSFAALQVRDDLDTVPGLFFNPPPDSRVIGIQVEIRSMQNSMLIIREIGVTDGEGYVYRMYSSEKIMMQGQRTVPSGDSVEDWVYFVVPSGFIADTVRLICNDSADPMEDVVLRSALS
jgi:hypothetical protein